MAESIFNRVAKSAGDWLYQQRHGSHALRKADMFLRVAAFPGGRELLRQAAELGVEFIVGSKKAIGSEGYFSTANGKLTIGVTNSGNPAAMAMALWHELRHMKQHAANPGSGLAGGGQLKDARTGHMMGLIAEADAFTVETVMALQQKKAGNPEYYDAMFARTELGPHRYIKNFLRQRPCESFSDDAEFARALFTGLMLEGLVSYSASYFSRLQMKFRLSDTLDAFRQEIGEAKQGGTRFGKELSSFYGEGFAMTSPRALTTAFFQAQPQDEQQALALVERTVRTAHRMTEAQFQQARNEILSRTQDIWFRDPEEPFFRSADAGKAAKTLERAALNDKPLPYAEIKPPTPSGR